MSAASKVARLEMGHRDPHRVKERPSDTVGPAWALIDLPAHAAYLSTRCRELGASFSSKF